MVHEPPGELAVTAEYLVEDAVECVDEGALEDAYDGYQCEAAADDELPGGMRGVPAEHEADDGHDQGDAGDEGREVEAFLHDLLGGCPCGGVGVFYALAEAGLLAVFFLMRLEEEGAQGGREGECVDGRQAGGHGHVRPNWR